MKKIIIAFIAVALASVQASALVLYGAGNSATASDPGNGLPWNSVVNIGNYGTAVHLGNGYFITASHVTLSHVNTSTGTVFAIDTSYGTNGSIKITGADLKIFRVTDPDVLNLESATLYDSIISDGTEVHHVGHGLGRDSTPINSADTDIYTSGIRAMRWGTNTAESEHINGEFWAYVTYANAPIDGNDPYDYTYEAALTGGDSGGPMFVEILGKWYVAGIAVSVSPSADPVRFGSDGTENINIILRSADYYDEINSLLPVPEPAQLAVAFGILALGFAAVRRRR